MKGEPGGKLDANQCECVYEITELTTKMPKIWCIGWFVENVFEFSTSGFINAEVKVQLHMA